MIWPRSRCGGHRRAARIAGLQPGPLDPRGAEGGPPIRHGRTCSQPPGKHRWERFVPWNFVPVSWTSDSPGKRKKAALFCELSAGFQVRMTHGAQTAVMSGAALMRHRVSRLGVQTHQEPPCASPGQTEVDGKRTCPRFLFPRHIGCPDPSHLNAGNARERFLLSWGFIPRAAAVRKNRCDTARNISQLISLPAIAREIGDAAHRSRDFHVPHPSRHCSSTDHPSCM
jgi:hypothetical protein